MARIGLKGMTYARFTSGGEGNAIVYANGTTQAGRMIRAEVTVNRNDAKQYADNGTVEKDNSVTGVDITLELARLSDAEKEMLVGYVAGADGTLTVTESEAPYVGFGYITCEIANGTKSYIGYWYHKVQFGIETDSASTKGERTEFESVNLRGSAMGVQLTAAGAVEFYKTKSAETEAAVRTWLNTQANISA